MRTAYTGDGIDLANGAFAVLGACSLKDLGFRGGFRV